MFLRKLSEHLRSQNWVAVVLDFFIVVVGIFVGLQVDNWNQWRIDRADEKTLLLSLSTDFARNDALLAEVKQNHRLVANAGQAIITYGDAGSVPDDERVQFETFVSNHGARYTYTPVTGTVDNLLGTNKINLLRNEELISLLTEWPQVVASLNEEEVNARNHYQERIFPFLAPRIDFKDHDKGYSGCCFDDPATGTKGINQIEYPWKQKPTDTYLLVNDREFLSLIYWHWVHSMNKLSALREVERSQKAIREQLDQELDK